MLSQDARVTQRSRDCSRLRDSSTEWDQTAIAVCLPAPAFAASAFAVAVVPAATAATRAAASAFEAAAEAAAAETTAAAVTTAATAIAVAAATTASAEAAASAAASAKAATTTGATAAEAATAASAQRTRLGLEAIAAVDRAITSWFEGDLRFFSARCACRIEQLSRWTTIAAGESSTITILLLLQPAAVGTTPRFPCEPF